MAALTMYDILMQLPIFQGLSRDQMTHILEVIPFEFKMFSQGEVISRGGEQCRGAVFIISGKVKLVTPVFSRRVSIEQVYHAPYTFSLHHMFGADTTAHSTMVADADKTGIMLLEKRDFMRLMQENEIVLINVMNILCTRAQKRHKTIDFGGEPEPVAKIASWILSFTERAASEVSIMAEESDWSEMLQLDVATFWRSVAMLEGLHALEVVKGRLKLLDRYALKSIVNNKSAQKA